MHEFVASQDEASLDVSLPVTIKHRYPIPASKEEDGGSLINLEAEKNFGPCEE